MCIVCFHVFLLCGSFALSLFFFLALGCVAVKLETDPELIATNIDGSRSMGRRADERCRGCSVQRPTTTACLECNETRAVLVMIVSTFDSSTRRTTGERNKAASRIRRRRRRSSEQSVCQLSKWNERCYCTFEKIILMIPRCPRYCMLDIIVHESGFESSLCIWRYPRAYCWNPIGYCWRYLYYSLLFFCMRFFFNYYVFFSISIEYFDVFLIKFFIFFILFCWTVIYFFIYYWSMINDFLSTKLYCFEYSILLTHFFVILFNFRFLPELCIFL